MTANTEAMASAVQRLADTLAIAESRVQKQIAEIERLTADRDSVQSRFNDYRNDLHGMIADIRSVPRDEVCEQCSGTGVVVYGSTATWRGGIGGQAMTPGPCSKCWGSGNKHYPWPSHRNLGISRAEIEGQRAEIARLTARVRELEAADQWRTIESAPRDGSIFLLNVPSLRTGECRYPKSLDRFIFDSDAHTLADLKRLRATWRPMPAPAQQQGEG